MEMSILNQIRKTAGRVVEPWLLKGGKVLEVRRWEDGATIEIDLHLPGVDMAGWNEVPYIKFSVGDLCFRDYTPFGWDAETATCSLLIDVGHGGPGSNWAKHLQAGDQLNYLKIDKTHQSPHPTNFVVGLGDVSSLAHLLALQQLTLPNTRFDGAVLINRQHTSRLFKENFESRLTIATNQNEMINWLMSQGYCVAHTSFYLTGNYRLAGEMRKLLKSLGYNNIRLQGFWS
jgi:NADPH-dependent ferric siderophore reductase